MCCSFLTLSPDVSTLLTGPNFPAQITTKVLCSPDPSVPPGNNTDWLCSFTPAVLRVGLCLHLKPAASRCTLCFQQRAQTIWLQSAGRFPVHVRCLHSSSSSNHRGSWSHLLGFWPLCCNHMLSSFFLSHYCMCVCDPIGPTIFTSHGGFRRLMCKRLSENTG